MLVQPPRTATPIVAPVPSQRPVADIQRVIGMTGADIDGIRGRRTIAKTKEWQADHKLVPDGDWGIASDGTGFPPAGSIPGVDYSFARPAVSLLVQHNMKLAARYLASLDNKKRLSRTEHDLLVSAGITVPFIYEEDGKELTSFSEGVRVATLAETHRNREGFAPKPIYFNVDYDAQPAQYAGIFDALRGIASIIGVQRTGLYAGYKVMKAAFDEGLIYWGFQTYAWSGGLWDPRAQLQQWANGQWDDQVDFTRAVAAEYGQNPVVS